jgi:hypothetical protein
MRRVRFAPSPARVAPPRQRADRRRQPRLRRLAALRIDDTDATRTVEGGEQEIVGDLEWLGIE